MIHAPEIPSGALLVATSVASKPGTEPRQKVDNQYPVVSRELEARRKLDRERKQWERANNTAYAQRVRESKRGERVKARRRELRQRPEQKEKEKAYMRVHRQSRDAREKDNARGKVNYAIAHGKIVRPPCCQLCGAPDTKLRDGRSALRADHYAGYDTPLIVRFVCVKCDGEQERRRGNTTLGKRLVANKPEEFMARLGAADLIGESVLELLDKRGGLK